MSKSCTPLPHASLLRAQAKVVLPTNALSQLTSSPACLKRSCVQGRNDSGAALTCRPPWRTAPPGLATTAQAAQPNHQRRIPAAEPLTVTLHAMWRNCGLLLNSGEVGMGAGRVSGAF